MLTRISTGEQGTVHADLPHVLLVVDGFPKTLGGGERIVLRLAELLPRYGFRASILTFTIHPECTWLQDAPCPIWLLPLEKTYDLRAMRAAREFGRFLKREEVQVVQTFFESSDIWGGAVTKALSDAKLVWSRRDMGILRGRKHRIAYRLLSGLPDRVFAVSDQVRSHCIAVDGVAPSRVETVYNGLELGDWGAREQAAVADGPTVTTVGNIRRVKGHDVFVRAAALVARRFPSARFTVAGEVLEPEYFAELQSLVEQLGLGGHFQFVGPVSDLSEHLAAADVFVLPSRSEGFSNALIEAMAASLPVVATNVGGNAEAVIEGATGYIVPPEDEEALAEAISKLLRDPCHAGRMGARGRRRAEEKFTTDAMMRQVAKSYTDLLRA
jgi:L-malate glycosyltransferase